MFILYPKTRVMRNTPTHTHTPALIVFYVRAAAYSISFS